jgi:hypothetical protein
VSCVSDIRKAVPARAHKGHPFAIESVWRDKPSADVMSLGIGSGLQLLCCFSHVHRGRKAFFTVTVNDQNKVIIPKER